MRARSFKNPLILCIGLIIAMSILGAGYASWNNGLIVESSVATGYIDPVFSLDDDYIGEDDGKLKLKLSEDNRKLSIEGEIYPSFDEDVKINIKNNGSIPVLLDDFAILRSEGIDTIKEDEDGKYNEDVISSYVLNINPENVGDASNMRKQDFESLEDEIESYSKSDFYEFEYEMLLKQEP